MNLEEALKFEMPAFAYGDFKLCPALRQEVEDLEEAVIRLREKLKKDRMSALSSVPRARGNAQDIFAPMIAALMELEEMYAIRATGYYEHLRRVEIAIASIWKPEMRRIMRMKYILGLTWDQIASKTHFDERWCRELHNRGLRALGIEKEKGA